MRREEEVISIANLLDLYVANPLLIMVSEVVAKDVNKTPSQVAINWAICKLLGAFFAFFLFDMMIYIT